MDEGTWDYFPCVSLIHYTLIHHTHSYVEKEIKRERRIRREEGEEGRRRKPKLQAKGSH